MSTGYNDGYDSREERRRDKHRHNRRPGSKDSDYGSGDETVVKEKKKKSLSGKEKGLGASLLGGAGGAFVGHEMGGGALGTILGIGAGAVGAALLEKDHEKQKKKEAERESKKHLKYQDDFEYGSSDVGPAGHHHREAPPPMMHSYNEDQRSGRRERSRRQRSRSRGRRDSPDDSSSDSEYARRRN